MEQAVWKVRTPERPSGLEQGAHGAGPLSALGSRLGNEVLGAALIGGGLSAGDAFSGAACAAGLAHITGVAQGDPFGSNQAMMRWLRHGQGAAEPSAIGTATRLMSVSAGAPLPAPILQRLSLILGHDLRGVRVHVDGSAARAAEAISARAFTVGREVFFNTGEYQPGTAAGDALLLHELTHVVQHDEGRTAGERGLSSPTDPAELEAERVSRALLPELQALEPLAPLEDGTAGWDVDAWVHEPVRQEGAAIARQEDSSEEEGWLDTLYTIAGDTLLGDFGEDPHLVAILIRTLIGLVPIADQVLDGQDICAGLYKLLYEGRIDEAAVWLGLVLTLIGCIPELGSVVKGLGKACLKVIGDVAAKGARAVPVDELLKLLGDTAHKLDLDEQYQLLLTHLDALAAELDPKTLAGAIQAQLAELLQAVITRGEEARRVLGVISEDTAAVVGALVQNARAALKAAPKQVEQALDGARKALGEVQRLVREELGRRSARRALGDAEFTRLETALGPQLTRTLCGTMDGATLKALHQKLGSDVMRRLGAGLDGASLGRVGEALARDTLEILLKDLSPNAILKLVQRCSGDALDALAPALKGPGLEALSRMDFFKFDPALKSLLDAGQGAAARGLGDLSGRSVAEVKAALSTSGFTLNKTERGMEIWTHTDGSVARVKVSSPAIPDAEGRMESVVLEISKTPGQTESQDIIGKVAFNGSVVPKGPNFAGESLKQWFKKQVGRIPTAPELDALMEVWGDLCHIALSP